MKAIHNADFNSPSNPAGGRISDAEWDVTGQLFGRFHRELTVARRLFADVSRKQIALPERKSDGSSLSPETVRVDIDRLWRKLNVSSQVQRAIRPFDSTCKFARSTMDRHVPRVP